MFRTGLVQPTESWPETLKDYPDGDINMIRRLWLAAGLIRGSSVLDIGGGKGKMADILATSYTDIRYVNADPWTGYDVRRGLPFRAGEFETVLMLDVLDHLEDPWAAIAEAWRITRFRLICIVTLPGWPDWEGAHVWGINEQDLRELCFGNAAVEGLSPPPHSYSSFTLLHWQHCGWADKDAPWAEIVPGGGR